MTCAPRFERLALVVRLVLLGALANAPTRRAGAQATPTATSQQATKVFLDCGMCDFDFIRTEVTFVNWVRDRQVANVHLLVTAQSTGSGGTRYVLSFIGLPVAAGAAPDSLTYASQQTDTGDDVRKSLVRVIKLGLVRFVGNTPAAANLDVTYAAPVAATRAAAERDPWNHWVFNTGVHGNFNGEQTSRRENENVSIGASRITEAWKLSFGLDGNYSKSSFTFDSTTSHFYSDSYGANVLMVKNAGPHWSRGVNAGLSSSTRQNEQLDVYVGPAVEYDVFPYAQSTRRMLTLKYTLNAKAVRYDEETIYDKTSETLFNQSLGASLYLRQPWGSVSSSLSASHYLHDMTKWQSSFFNSVDVRLFKGFSVNLFGSVDLIRDQLYLAKGGASRDDVLLQRRQLETGYSYFAGVGINYTFGSIFNSIVNPRFGGGGGRMMMCC